MSQNEIMTPEEAQIVSWADNWGYRVPARKVLQTNRRIDETSPLYERTIQFPFAPTSLVRYGFFAGVGVLQSPELFQRVINSKSYVSQLDLFVCSRVPVTECCLELAIEQKSSHNIFIMIEPDELVIKLGGRGRFTVPKNGATCGVISQLLKQLEELSGGAR
ncbi:MAG: hypothetical protein KKB21_02790 [Nanoarchaeota archaeon]|nr:hypothetical protein [Nanoarchaeota archaeon]MBU4086482.1 hypothetical protein [Nanoarchaeota archaeon]